MKKLLSLLLPILAILSLAGLVSAQDDIEIPSMTTWSTKLVPADARAGESAQIVLTAKLNGDWHIYDMNRVEGPYPLEITLADNKAVTKNGDFLLPKPISHKDPNFNDVVVGYYEGAVSIGIPVKIADDAKGKQKVEVAVAWQTCNPKSCLPPEDKNPAVEFTVADGAARADRTAALTKVPEQPKEYEVNLNHKPDEHATAGTTEGGTTGSGSTAGSGSGEGRVEAIGDAKQIEDAKEKGLLSFIWLAFASGLVALLTPCVFPMIPITVSYFSKKSGSDKKINYSGAGLYCIGIMGTFTALGLAITMIFGAGKIQELANNPWINLGLAALFFVLALSLLEVFELKLPSGMVNKAHSASTKGGWVGPILMGLTFALTSFTCTAPFLGSVLIMATKGEAWWAMIGMLSFSAAFAFPFFFLAMFPQYLAKLPKSGSWMTSVKGFMAFLEMAAAIKFLSNADLQWQLAWLTRPVFLSLWAIIFMISALYLFGFVVIGHATQAPKLGAGRWTVATLMVFLTFYCVVAVNGRSLGWAEGFMPPDPYPGQQGKGGGHGGIEWITDYKTALAKSKETGKPMFIDFTGVNCTNCRWMEKNMFPKDQIKDLITKNYIPVSLYTDRKTPEDKFNMKLEMKLTNTVTLPVYVLLSSDEKVLAKFEGMTEQESQYAAFLKQGVDTKVASNKAPAAATP